MCVVLNCSGSLVETMYEGGEVWVDCSNGRRELAIFCLNLKIFMVLL